jgi:hypothetical protein
MAENFQAKESRKAEEEDYKKFRAKPTFDLLLSRYMCQATVLKNCPREKRPRSPPRQEVDTMQ